MEFIAIDSVYKVNRYNAQLFSVFSLPRYMNIFKSYIQNATFLVEFETLKFNTQTRRNHVCTQIGTALSKTQLSGFWIISFTPVHFHLKFKRPPLFVDRIIF